ncbi:MAG: hypothetical protein DMD91_18065 [Candidatus Rokuibacteriota bacterium]|nr:MAG: hypothetical protein DMD91_18065 [Candidatus Rokubacteria bacterium]
MDRLRPRCRALRHRGGTELRGRRGPRRARPAAARVVAGHLADRRCAVLGAGLAGVLIALGVVYTPTFARLMRGQVLAITARDYVDAARALGAPGWRIAWRHVLPSATAPMVVQASLSVAFAILAEASLSFLGLGIQPPAASWGSMINAGRGYLQQAPWIVFGPGAALFVTVVGLNFVGDAVRDALDPRLRE